ncbi:MAG TPA: hypothetical protein VN843_35355 [Anaerolineales bacterium]|nr:hypothetical protein [Anaerolineales bacterium]
MIANIKSSFIAFELNTDEEREAYRYNDLQIAGIQNLIAAGAEELVQALITNDRNSLEEQVKLAYTKGQIDILKNLLGRADVAAEEAERKAELERLQNPSNNFPQ